MAVFSSKVKPCLAVLLSAVSITAAWSEEPNITEQVVVATSAREFAASLTPDGGTIFFNRSSDNGAWYIWKADYKGVEVGDAEPMWFSDERYGDVDPFVSRSGDRLYFSSDRPPPSCASAEPVEDNNTWYAEWDGEAWTTLHFADETINSSASETFVSESAAGELIFTRFGEGRGRARPAYLMLSERLEDGFTEPDQLATKPEGLRLSNPAISPDGALIVAAGTQGDGPKLYYSEKTDQGEWSNFRALPAPVNIEGAAQFAPYISNDGEWLYFSSDRGGVEGTRDDNIYRVPLNDLLTQ